MYLQNGTKFILSQPQTENDIIHLKFCTEAEKCDGEKANVGKNAFLFLFYKTNGQSINKEQYCNSPFMGEGTGFVPYMFVDTEDDYWDYEKNCRQVVYPDDSEIKDILLSDTRYGCGSSSTNAYCTKIIQLNGWKIPDDYPIKF